MSNWDGAYGPQGSKSNGNKGVAAQVRASKRVAAETRNALTPPERRRSFRLGQYHSGDLVPHSNSRDARVLAAEGVFFTL